MLLRNLLRAAWPKTVSQGDALAESGEQRRCYQLLPGEKGEEGSEVGGEASMRSGDESLTFP